MDFARMPSSLACSADPRVRSIGGGVRALFSGAAFCGPARTAKVAAGDNGAIHRAVHIAAPGDVIVVAAAGDRGHGYFGDLLATACLSRSVAGVVIDACVRDVDAIRELGFPVFCLGANPGQTQKSDPGEVDAPVVCGGATVSPGDIVIADADGVAIVPRDAAEAVSSAAQQALKREEDVRRRIERGESTAEIFRLADPHPR